MDQKEMQQIVELVARQVMAAMGTGETDACAEGKEKLLVLAKPGVTVPEELTRDAVVFDLADYEKNRNILRYDRVVIASLGMTQLVDIAQARISDPVTCAVLNALLNGIDVVMLESALEYKKFAGKGSAALYGTLESYARTLGVFGVKLICEKQPAPVVKEAKPPRFEAPPVEVPKGTAEPSVGRLVTEAQALDLIKEGASIRLPAGTIVTPAAKDVFARAKVELIRG